MNIKKREKKWRLLAFGKSKTAIIIGMVYTENRTHNILKMMWFMQYNMLFSNCVMENYFHRMRTHIHPFIVSGAIFFSSYYLPFAQRKSLTISFFHSSIFILCTVEISRLTISISCHVIMYTKGRFCIGFRSHFRWYVEASTEIDNDCDVA